MTTAHTLLTFDFDDARFGVDATLVRECVWLPELTPVEEAPPYIVGIFSLRGQMIPVTDLNLRFNHPALPYRLNDQIVVLELDHLLMGLIVNEVIEVITVEGGMILQSDNRQYAFSNQHSAIEMVRVGDDLVTLLDASQLMHLPQAPNILPDGTTSHSTKPASGQVAGYLPSAGEGWGGGNHFCPEATPQEHAVFRARAKALMEAAIEEDGARLSLAVVELDGEYFGIELHAVQEFCDIAQPSPIPCCPPHILGAINLRGNLLTLLDIRAALNLPHASQGCCKAVIASASASPGTGEQRVGVAVDQVHDVIYLREEELQAAPAALHEQHGAEVRGTAAYGGRMMTVLNLPALLAREEWIVNEQC